MVNILIQIYKLIMVISEAGQLETQAYAIAAKRLSCFHYSNGLPVKVVEEENK